MINRYATPAPSKRQSHENAEALGDANRRNWHVRTLAEIIGAVVLLPGGAAAAASAAAPSAKGTTIRACENS